MSLLPLTGCISGRRYQSGALRFENVHMGIFSFERREDGSRYSYVAEWFDTFGSRWTGVQYGSILNGLWLSVNFPGSSWLLYPFQYADLSTERRPFGIGSGEGDFRQSLLWGFLSLGRDWNFLWIRGFWWGRRDPLFEKQPTPEVFEAFKTMERPKREPPPGPEPRQ